MYACFILLQNYSKQAVMELALPVAVKFLHQGNRELSRNLSSYLSLAAIDNAQLLATHMQALLDSIIAGNKHSFVYAYCICHILLFLQRQRTVLY